MLVTTTPQALTHYQLTRREELSALAGRLCVLYGLPNIQVSIDNREKNACKLTRDGVSLAFNPDVVVELSGREWPGAKADLPLALADLIVMAHGMSRARDFTNADFLIESEQPLAPDRHSRRFFNTIIDDMVIDAHLFAIPLLDRYRDAYATRLVDHRLADLPLHIQFMQSLRLRCIEREPHIVCSPLVDEALCQTGETLKAIIDPATSFAARRDLAHTRLYPRYQSLLTIDAQKRDRYLFNKLYESQNLYGSSNTGDASEFADFDDQALDERSDLYNMVAANLEDIPMSALKEVVEGTQDDEAVYQADLMLPRSGEATDELDLEDEGEPGYLELVASWQRVITDVATVLLKLATPHESIAVPRYRPIAHSEGVRLNPAALIPTAIQLKTGRPQAIWQPIEMRIRHQELQFCGLDIYLLFDVSGSMGGASARYATAMALCLIEGLQLARLRAERDQMQGSVDVRTQLLAFGSGWAELTPLGKEVTPAQKEAAFYNLMHPKSNFTLINGALRHVRTHALAAPARKVLCLIISDGLFSDSLAAFKTVSSMPPSAYVGHINIGEAYSFPITPHSQAIKDPKALPKKLQIILEEYFKSQTAFSALRS